MKFLLIAAVVGLALTAPIFANDACSADAIPKGKSYPKKFPTSNFGHAHCHIAYDTIEGTTCHDVIESLLTTIEAWQPEEDTHGFYNLHSCHETEGDLNYVWAYRLTGDKKYTDDLVYTLEDKENSCHIEGQSRSQSASYWDFYTNFCNIRNPLEKQIPDLLAERKVGKCGFKPKNHDEEVKECALH